MSRQRRYVVISPCRDEAAFMRRTLESVARQTVPPTKWIVVDDGSKDDTPRILAEYAERLPYLQVVRRDDRGRRSVGPGVIEAFYAGLAAVDLDEYDYVCKLDLDLQLPPKYFEIMMQKMAADPRLGTCSGKPYFPDKTGRLVSEGCGDENSVGMIKFYRVECFRDVGGFVREVMWDGIDGHRCRMAGWKARSWDEEELRFVHLRPMGSSDKGIWNGRQRHGYGQYFMGTSPLYMLASSLYRAARPPYLIGGAGMLVGYIKAAMRGAPKYQDKAFRAFLRRYQRECLLNGKRVATERIERQMLHEDGDLTVRRGTRANEPAAGGAPALNRRMKTAGG
jgi:poly-beta-1,6-N-acetyl-D-glucosamine synthase